MQLCKHLRYELAGRQEHSGTVEGEIVKAHAKSPARDQEITHAPKAILTTTTFQPVS